MCRIRTPKPPKIPSTPIYATPPPAAPVEPPIIEPADKQVFSNEAATLRAKRKGARGLRTDLGVTPGAVTNTGGLVIPKPVN